MKIDKKETENQDEQVILEKFKKQEAIRGNGRRTKKRININKNTF